MDEVVDSIRRVTNIVGEITAASREQTTGIEQINRAVIEMDNVTQQNAALVEEAAAAASSLQDQAGKLQQEVTVFKLSDEHHPTKKTAAVASGGFRHDVARSAPKLGRASLATPRVKTLESGKQVSRQVATVAGDEWEQF